MFTLDAMYTAMLGMSSMDTSTPFTVDWHSSSTIAIILTTATTKALRRHGGSAPAGAARAAAVGLVANALKVGSVAACAGVGGGAIFIPLLQFVAGFGLKDSTALSQALITAGSLVTVALNLLKPSPLASGTCVINFDLALLLTPAILSGVSIGVIGNTVCPPWLVTLLLILLMLLLVMQAISKGLAMWGAESLNRQQVATTQSADDAEAAAGQVTLSSQKAPAPAALLSCPEHKQGWAVVAPVCCERRTALQPLPGRTLVSMTATWLVFALLQLARTLPNVVRCSPTYWLLLVAQLSLMLLASCAQASSMLDAMAPKARRATRIRVVVQAGEELLQHQTQANKMCDDSGEEEEEEEGEGEGEEEEKEEGWGVGGGQEGGGSLRRPLLGSVRGSRAGGGGEEVLGGGGGALAAAMAMTCIAGIVGGLLGLGGGMVVTPLLLHLRVHPQVTSATSSLMVLLSSSGALFSYTVLQRVNPHYALAYGAASMLASALGMVVLGGLLPTTPCSSPNPSQMRRTGRSSLVVFALAVVMAMGLVCITGFGVQPLLKAWANRSQGMGFHNMTCVSELGTFPSLPGRPQSSPPTWQR
ncbi:hypothetical protein V8C86DRAFT_3033907 [Haematococcus lacustris]